MAVTEVHVVRTPGESSRAGFITVGVASILGLRPNPLRKEATFTNDSDTVIYGAKGPEAAINAGIRLNSNGGWWVIEPDATGRMYTGPVSFISTGANKNLCFTEDI